MTTLATLGDGIVAADSQCNWRDRMTLRASKLRRMPDGGVAGGSGSRSEILAVLDWLESGMRDEVPPMDDCDVMVIQPDGGVDIVCPNGVLSRIDGPMAIGSGAQAAMAAMVYFGASAEEAVMAAAEVDPNTSAPVDVMRVEPRAKRRKK